MYFRCQRVSGKYVLKTCTIGQWSRFVGKMPTIANGDYMFALPYVYFFTLSISCYVIASQNGSFRFCEWITYKLHKTDDINTVMKGFNSKMFVQNQHPTDVSDIQITYKVQFCKQTGYASEWVTLKNFQKSYKTPVNFKPSKCKSF